jgi:PEP-CTERM motif
MSKALLAAVLIAGGLALSAPAFADPGLTSVVNPTAYPNGDNQDWSLGWSFSTTGETLTSLGYNDDGFNSDHQVGVFDASFNLLASATVTGASTLDNGYRYTNLVTPLVLAAGVYYLSGTTLGLNDGWTYQADSFTTNAATTYLGSYYTGGGGGFLNAPTTFAEGRQYLEVNFNGGGSGTPEPQAWALMLLGFGLTGYALRRRIALA